MDSDTEIDAEISQMPEETFAGLEKQKFIRISMAENYRESIFLTEIQLLRSSHDVLMREWKVEIIFPRY